MRTHPRRHTAAAAVALIAGVTIAAGPGPAAATPQPGHCDGGWNLVPTPQPPGGNAIGPSPVTGGPQGVGGFIGSQAEIGSVSVLSATDAWFTGASVFPGNQLWNLKWNGHALTTASDVPPGLSPGRYTQSDLSSFDSGTDGWEGGSAFPLTAPTVERWHDGGWTMTPTAAFQPTASTNSGTYRVVLQSIKSLSPDNAWAVGETVPFSLKPDGAVAEHWDGTQWNAIPNPASAQQGGGLNGLTAVSPTDLWAVGQQTDASGTLVPLAEHWDGSSWSTVPVPAPAGSKDTALNAVYADSATDAWAVGSWTDATGMTLPLAEHWDGTAWSIATGLPGIGYSSDFSDVYAAAPNDVWATVEATETVSGLTAVFAHWDGAHWTTVPVPGPQEYGLEYDYAHISGAGPGDIWATGSAYNTGDLAFTPVIAHLGCD